MDSVPHWTGELDIACHTVHGAAVGRAEQRARRALEGRTYPIPSVLEPGRVRPLYRERRRRDVSLANRVLHQSCKPRLQT
eukprot:2744857-Prymnesium_polylepis.1